MARGGWQGTQRCGGLTWTWILLDDPGCIGCGICADLCPHGAVTMTRCMTHPVPGEHPCDGCGTCVKECPVNTLRLRPAHGRPVAA